MTNRKRLRIMIHLRPYLRLNQHVFVCENGLNTDRSLMAPENKAPTDRNIRVTAIPW